MLGLAIGALVFRRSGAGSDARDCRHLIICSPVRIFTRASKIDLKIVIVPLGFRHVQETDVFVPLVSLFIIFNNIITILYI